jgi:hypothetical protein
MRRRGGYDAACAPLRQRERGAQQARARCHGVANDYAPRRQVHVRQ